MGELAASIAQGLLGQLAVGYVLDGADEQRSAVNMLEHPSQAAHMLDAATRRADTKGEIELCTLHRSLDARIIHRQILRLDQAAHLLQRYLGGGIELENAECF